MPDHIGSELSEEEHRKRSRADAVHVVVAVHANPLLGGDCRPDALDRLCHVAELVRVVPGKLGVEKASSGVGIVVSAACENGGGDGTQPKLSLELAGSRRVELGNRPHTRHDG